MNILMMYFRLYKSSFISWEEDDGSRIKLKIGSNVRPNPYEKRTIKTYIQEYLEHIGNEEVIKEYDLNDIPSNAVLKQASL